MLYEPNEVLSITSQHLSEIILTVTLLRLG